MVSSQSPQDNGHSQTVSITLTDEVGRSLQCYIEQLLNVEGQEYALLLPDDAPVEIFTNGYLILTRWIFFAMVLGLNVTAVYIVCTSILCF